MVDLKNIIFEELSNTKNDSFFTILNEKNGFDLVYSIFQEYLKNGQINLDNQKAGEVIFLEAPTGSGKDFIFLQLVHKNPDKHYIELNMDMFRKYYRLFVSEQESFNDIEYAKKTNQFTYEIFTIIQQILLKYFPSSNIVITGSLRETDWNEEFMRTYKQNGYKVKLATITVSKKEGLFSIIKRYIEMVDKKRKNPNFVNGTVRYTSFRYFEETYEKFIQNFSYFVNMYYEHPGELIDTIDVYRRSKSLDDFDDDNLVYSSDINKDESPLDAVVRLRNAEFVLREQELDHIFTLIENNREYLQEQKTLRDILYTLVYLLKDNYMFGGPKRGK